MRNDIDLITFPLYISNEEQKGKLRGNITTPKIEVKITLQLSSKHLYGNYN